jgi:hypothetical protein
VKPKLACELELHLAQLYVLARRTALAHALFGLLA